MRNKRPDLNGILPIDKPLGWSSAKVCRWMRALTDGAKVGHAGTLDPLATGVLVLCLGRATKSVESLMDGVKRYKAAIDLAHTSPTDDAEGELTPVEVEVIPSFADITSVCQSFVGTIEQTPPAYSAVWVAGTRAYHHARRGNEVDLKPRRIVIDALEILSYDWPQLKLDITCRRGTYIRSLARDLGVKLGTGGMLAKLVRTESSGFVLDDCACVEELEQPGAIETRIVPVDLP